MTFSSKVTSHFLKFKKLNLTNGLTIKGGKICKSLLQLEITTKILSMIFWKMKLSGKSGTIIKDLKLKNFLKDMENSLRSRFSSFWEFLDLIESLMEWKGSSLMHIKMINLSNLQQSTMKKYSRPPVKNLQSFSSYLQELIHYQMFKN